MDKSTGERISSVDIDYPRTTAEFEDIRHRNAAIEAIGISTIAEDTLEQVRYPQTPCIYLPIPSLTASRDAATIRAVIEAKYGFTPTLDYCRDLVAFVEALTDGQ